MCSQVATNGLDFCLRRFGISRGDSSSLSRAKVSPLHVAIYTVGVEADTIDHWACRSWDYVAYFQLCIVSWFEAKLNVPLILRRRGLVIGVRQSVTNWLKS